MKTEYRFRACLARIPNLPRQISSRTGCLQVVLRRLAATATCESAVSGSAATHGATRHAAQRARRFGRKRVTSWEGDIEHRRLDCLHIGPAEIRAGDRVRLRPRDRADILDLALAGKTATVESIEQDYEGRAYVTVTVDDDPGKDLGALRQPGHRFFFSPDEIEPLTGGMEDS